MNQYLLLIQGNIQSEPTAEEWNQFFVAAEKSGCFRGGSEVGERIVLGDILSAKSSAHIVGYMRFDAEDKQTILDLLTIHPVVLHGGSMELCDLPKS